MKANAKFWDGIAEKYAKTAIGDMPAYETTLERSRSYLQKNHRVLELGCGTGTTAIHLAGAAGEIIATDCSNAMLEVGRGRAWDQSVENISFVQADVSAPPEGPFDVVMAFNLLHLLEGFEGTLTKIHGLLKPGGHFISKTTCKPENGVSCRYSIMMAILPVMQLFGKAPYVRMRKVREFEDAVENAGFEIIETGSYPVKPPARFIVARK